MGREEGIEGLIFVPVRDFLAHQIPILKGSVKSKLYSQITSTLGIPIENLTLSPSLRFPSEIYGEIFNYVKRKLIY